MQKIINGFKKIDKNTYKIIKYGLTFSTFLSIIATTLLFSYILLGINFLYYLGIVLIQSSFYLSVEFIVCGIVVDSLKKQ